MFETCELMHIICYVGVYKCNQSNKSDKAAGKCKNAHYLYKVPLAVKQISYTPDVFH